MNHLYIASRNANSSGALENNLPAFYKTKHALSYDHMTQQLYSSAFIAKKGKPRFTQKPAHKCSHQLYL